MEKNSEDKFLGLLCLNVTLLSHLSRSHTLRELREQEINAT